MTLREAVVWGAGALRAMPEISENAMRDAELLLLHQLSLTRAELRAYPERELPAESWELYRTRIARRLRMEPVQYITGEQEFYGLTLKVTPAVLIPRLETELLIERVLVALPADQPLHMLDVGTGSGAIAVALAKHLPEATITAVDLSREALAVAGSNAETHGVASRIRFVESDLLGALAGERFDVVVSNPPYVPLVERESLHPEVREHEPALALFAGETGVDVYQRLIPEAWNGLQPSGLLALEIGFGQGDRIAALLGKWRDVSFYEDLQGIPRVVLARRPD